LYFKVLYSTLQVPSEWAGTISNFIEKRVIIYVFNLPAPLLAIIYDDTL